MRSKFSLVLLLSMGFAPVLVPFASIAAAEETQNVSTVRRIYIEKMDNNLDEYLASAISKKFHGTVTVVLQKASADAVLRGMNTAAQNTRQSNIELVDRNGRAVLWSGSAGDRSMMFLNMKHGGEQALADHLIGELKKAMQP